MTDELNQKQDTGQNSSLVTDVQSSGEAPSQPNEIQGADNINPMGVGTAATLPSPPSRPTGTSNTISPPMAQAGSTGGALPTQRYLDELSGAAKEHYDQYNHTFTLDNLKNIDRDNEAHYLRLHAHMVTQILAFLWMKHPDKDDEHLLSTIAALVAIDKHIS